MLSLLALLALALLALHLATAILAGRHARRPAPARMTPHVCLMRPVCGLDRHDLATLETSFRLDYPDFEILFCAAHEADAAVAPLRAMIARHPGVRARLLIGERRISANPKLNNLAKGWDASDAEWIAIADANLALPPDYLRQLLASWREDTGLVSSPPSGSEVEGLWGALEAAFLNTCQARWQLAADQVGWGFAQGKTLFLRRELLQRQGGLAALGRDLAEDVAATKIVREAGLKVRLVPQPFGQPVGRRSLTAVWQRQLRWSRIRRQGFPRLFRLEPLIGPVLPALVLAAVSPLLAAGHLALWYGAEWALARVMGWPRGLRDMTAWVLRDLLLPVLWLATFARSGFEWRGTAMGADAPADLSALGA